MKRIVIILLTFLVMGLTTSNAMADNVRTSGLYTYEIKGNGTITIYVYVEGNYLCCDIYEYTGNNNRVNSFEYNGNKSGSDNSGNTGFSGFGGLGGLGSLGGSSSDDSEDVSGFGGLGGLGILGGGSDNDDDSDSGLGNIGGGLSW